jgi:hypothetical protein
VLECYLGDSYDLVKRFWSKSLEPIGPLYAHPKFVPSAIYAKYTAVTSVPILGTRPEGHCGILLDPDTGVPLPSSSSHSATRSHASLQFIVDLTRELHPDYMICFDQSYHRKHALNRDEQKEAKRTFLSDQGIVSFYYVSHAPFLFMASEKKILRSVLGRLISLGIPKRLFHPSDIV